MKKRRLAQLASHWHTLTPPHLHTLIPAHPHIHTPSHPLTSTPAHPHGRSSPLQAERVKVDGEEARYQAERRREAIERAKTHLYYQTDRVKQFHVRTQAVLLYFISFSLRSLSTALYKNHTNDMSCSIASPKTSCSPHSQLLRKGVGSLAIGMRLPVV